MRPHPVAAIQLRACRRGDVCGQGHRQQRIQRRAEAVGEPLARPGQPVGCGQRAQPGVDLEPGAGEVPCRDRPPLVVLHEPMPGLGHREKRIDTLEQPPERAGIRTPGREVQSFIPLVQPGQHQHTVQLRVLELVDHRHREVRR